MSSVLFEGCASSGVKYCIGIVFDVNFFLSPLLTAILGIYYIVHLFFLQYSTGNAASSTVHRTMHDLISYDAQFAKPCSAIGEKRKGPVPATVETTESQGQTLLFCRRIKETACAE